MAIFLLHNKSKENIIFFKKINTKDFITFVFIFCFTLTLLLSNDL